MSEGGSDAQDEPLLACILLMMNNAEQRAKINFCGLLLSQLK